MKRPIAKKKRKPRLLWTKADISMLKALVRETEKTTVIARKLKRTVRATQQKASMLGVRCQKRFNGREGRNGRLSSTSGDSNAQIQRWAARAFPP